MSTPILARSTAARTAAGEEIEHTVCCCNDDLALCGTDVADAAWNVGGPECAVCEDLAIRPCERCGFGPYDESCWCGECA